MWVHVRQEQEGDIAGIGRVHIEAFRQVQEGQLVDALRADGGVLLSLVAVLESRIVGHILYTPVSLGPGRREVTGSGLGPMAVLPELQRQGIGGRLIEAGNQRLRENGCPFIVVLGHPEYYPRFGFNPASDHGIQCQWDVPEDVFMILVLDEDQMRGVSGLARYRPEFSRFG